MDGDLNYGNHRILVPGYHFVLSAILVINLLFTLWKLFTDFSLDRGIAALVAVGLVLMFWYVRLFPLKAQDRVIRLEMLLRLQEVLPEDLRSRISELGRGQLIGLRFASDGELPGLVRDALDQKLGGEDIKKKIQSWQADTWRF